MKSGDVCGSILGVPEKKRTRPTEFKEFNLSCYKTNEEEKYEDIDTPEPHEKLTVIPEVSISEGLRGELPKTKLPLMRRQLEDVHKVQKVIHNNFEKPEEDEQSVFDKENVEVIPKSKETKNSKRKLYKETKIPSLRATEEPVNRTINFDNCDISVGLSSRNHDNDIPNRIFGKNIYYNNENYNFL